MKVLKMKNSTSQTKNSMETITNRLDQEEEGISGIHDKIKEVSYSNNNKVKKKCNHGHNIQKFWSTIKRPNLEIYGVEDETEIQTKGTEILLIEITADNCLRLGKEIDIQVQDVFRS
jgi:hypothetical protein